MTSQLGASCKGCRPSRLRRTKMSSDTKLRREKSCSDHRMCPRRRHLLAAIVPQSCRSFVHQDLHHRHVGSCPARSRGSMREPQKTLQGPHSSSQTGLISSLAQSVQISRASPACLLWSAFQSLQRLPRATGDVLRSNFEHEACILVRCTGLWR